MTAKIYTLILIAGIFFLWGWFSDWSLDTMFFYEGHDSYSNGQPNFGYLARAALAFILIIVAFITALSPQDKRGR